MEKRSSCNTSVSAKMKHNWRNCKVGDNVLLKEAAAEQNSLPMVKTVAMNADKNGFARSVKLMLGTSGTTDMALQYLDWPVNKLVMLVENEWLRWYAFWVRFHNKEPLMNDWEVSICFNILRGAMCRRDIGIETRCGLRLKFFWTLLLIFLKSCFSTLNLFFKTWLLFYHS